MDITRLTSVLDADPAEVEAVVVRIEAAGSNERPDLIVELIRALRLHEATGSLATAGARRPPHTDLADEAAAESGFD